jgi:hypothetical protein
MKRKSICKSKKVTQSQLMNLPLILTKLELMTEHPNHYRATFNTQWRFINTYEQIRECANNWHEFSDIILPIERKKKINRLMNTENKIYTDKVLFEKNNY